MISLTQEQKWTIASGLAIGALAIIAAYDLLTPKPEPAVPTTKLGADAGRLTTENLIAKKKLSESEAEVKRLTWSTNADQIGSSALNTVTTLSQSKGLKLLAFRPQRTAEDGGLTRLPYMISLEGPYLGVIGFLRMLETPSNKLAVNLVQVASADPSSDRVSATVGVVAFRPSKVAVKESKAVKK